MITEDPRSTDRTAAGHRMFICWTVGPARRAGVLRMTVAGHRIATNEG
jgi:hypothetical protein